MEQRRLSPEERARQRKIRFFRTMGRRIIAVALLIVIATGAVVLVKGCVTRSTLAAEDTSDTAESVSVEITSPEIVITTEVLHDDPDLDALEFPFNQMSADWSEEDLDGWWRYTIPEKYEKTGGYLPDLVQVYAYCLCKQNDISYPMLLALMEFESGYQYDAVSTANDIGYLQINYKWQIDKMSDMKEKALYNPYINIQVGIQYLKELSDDFNTEEAVLTAYHYGPAGAYSYCFNDPEITSDYAKKIIAIEERIDSELKAREEEANGQNSES